jgi:hypothetical protein
MGQTELNWVSYSPHRALQERLEELVAGGRVRVELRHVAVQVEFERQTLKPGYYLIGNHLKPGAFKLMGQLDSTCTAPPT